MKEEQSVDDSKEVLKKQEPVDQGKTIEEEQSDKKSGEMEKPEDTVPAQDNLRKERPDSLKGEEAILDKPQDAMVSPYNFDAGEQHKLIYLLPKGGSSMALLTTYLRRFNAMKYRGSNLVIKTEDFDELRSIMIVSGIGDLESAKKYMNDAESDSRVKMSLRNTDYRIYLISDSNLETFMASKDIAGYLKFYTEHY